MTAAQMAHSYLRRAQAVLREAQRLHRDAEWNLVVRRCQEAVDLALKGLLRSVGAEVPKAHDVGGALRRHAERFPPAVRSEVNMLVSASRRLREERELSFYGDEETETPAEDLYWRSDGDDALATARRVLDICAAGIES